MRKSTYHWTRHVAFRDYLLAHADVRAAYERLKLAIAEREFDDPLEYNSHEEAFIAEHQAKAMEWFRGQAGGGGSAPPRES